MNLAVVGVDMNVVMISSNPGQLTRGTGPLYTSAARC